MLDEPLKPQGGHRHYPSNMAKRIRFIKRAQALGFTLSEVEGLLMPQEARACTETRELAAHKLALIEQKISDLEVMRQVLGGLVHQCETGGPAACPIIDALARE